MKYIKEFNRVLEGKDIRFSKDDIIVDYVDIFDRITIKSQYAGVRRLISFDTKTRELKANLGDKFGDVIIDFLDSNKEDITKIISKYNFDNLYKTIVDKYHDLNNKNKVYNIERVDIACIDSGSFNRGVANKVIVYDSMLKIYMMNNSEPIIVNNDGLYYYERPCDFFAFYTKQTSKYYDMIRSSKNLYNLIRKYLPEFKLQFIDKDLINSLGWESNKYEYNWLKVKGYLPYKPYDENQVIFKKGDNKLVVDFTFNKAKIYDNSEEAILIDEFKLKSNDDLDKLKSEKY